jgi:hypothetical protein
MSTSEERMFYEGVDFKPENRREVLKVIHKETGKELTNPSIQHTGWGELTAHKSGVTITCPKDGVLVSSDSKDASGRDLSYLDVYLTEDGEIELLSNWDKSMNTLVDEDSGDRLYEMPKYGRGHVVGNAYMSRAEIEANVRAVKRGKPDERKFPGFFDGVRFGFANYHG